MDRMTLSPQDFGTAAARRNLAGHYRELLLQDCLPFWFPRCIDHEFGGFLHCFDRDGTLVDTDKSVWAQGRMSWMLLTLSQETELGAEQQRADWMNWGESGLRFLQQHCVSRQEPGPGEVQVSDQLYFQVTRDGRPLRKRRYVYSESFAAIAAAAHYAATGTASSAELAERWFKTFVHVNFTPGISPAKCSPARPLTGLASRMITLVTAQELRRCIGDSAERSGWLQRCIDEMLKLFIRPDLQCVMENVAPDGGIVDHFDGRTLNPGHAIEGAWFLMQESQQRGDVTLLETGCRMLDWMWERGWDQEFGGLYSFRDVYNKPVQEYWQEMKFWWPHDEALIATLMAWRLTSEPRYLEWHCQLFNWAFEHFSDPDHGEWFGYLHRDGSRSGTLKGNLWKSFFHHPRALWMCWKILSDSASEDQAG